MYFHFVDGRESESSLLSDGYRRLVNIVMDIAFRCALLNKTMYGEQSYKYTHGTVIIDEIDEHLHPELQVRILNALHKTFPKIQFIISTHAPLVMSSVENTPENVVYKLEYNNGVYSHKIIDTYGFDVSTIMDVYMGHMSRDIKIARKIKEIFNLIDSEDYKVARVKLNELQLSLPIGDPELSRADAILSFMEE